MCFLGFFFTQHSDRDLTLQSIISENITREPAVVMAWKASRTSVGVCNYVLSVSICGFPIFNASDLMCEISSP